MREVTSGVIRNENLSFFDFKIFNKNRLWQFITIIFLKKLKH